MSVYRELPSRPSLEYDRKQAKALQRALKRGDADAVERAAAQGHRVESPADGVSLAVAQLVIAREYGFSSWPRLVQYHEGIVRQIFIRSDLRPAEFYEREASMLLSGHATRNWRAGRLLAAYVPRFFGMRVDDVYAHDISAYEARLAVARSKGCPSWEVLLERTSNVMQRRRGRDQAATEVHAGAREIIKRRDLTALELLVSQHPELLHTSDDLRGWSIIYPVLEAEREQGREAMQPFVAWLMSRGLDVQLALNRSLYAMRLTLDELQALIDRGADLQWTAPNGVPVLEHALLQWWHEDGVVGEIAKRVVPRRALWILAGLGDVKGMRGFFDKNGRLIADAVKHRPPLDALGAMSIACLPDPGEQELLLEAFWVAAINRRKESMQFLIAHGFDVNTRSWGTPLVNIAVGNAWTPVVECLVAAGADLDVHEGNSNGTARDMARSMWRDNSYGPSYRRIVELCGLDADAIAAERESDT